MVAVLPKLRVGDPIRHEALTVFPLFWESTNTIEYRISDEALADQSVVVQEISEGGSVPELQVENKGDMRVLFLEGEQLVGAKQNRMLNTSVLIGAHSIVRIPVSCVEQGRWYYKSRHFAPSGSHSQGDVRYFLKMSVVNSLKTRHSFHSDQGAIWDKVSDLNARHKVQTPTGSLTDAYEQHQKTIDSYREKLQYVDQASGIAVAIGSRIVCLDFFDKPSTCQKVWNRLLSGFVFEALHEKPDEGVTVADVERLLTATNEMKWEPCPAVGEGEEYRAETDQGDYASALQFAGSTIHGNVLTGNPTAI